MDFGTLKNTFTQTYIESHVNGDNKGKELYKRFLEVLKESETLKTFFIVYKNLESKTINNQFEANEYLKEHLSVLNKFRGDKSIVLESKKLIKLLKDSEINVVSEQSTLHKSLHTLTTTSKNINTINDIHEAKISLVKSLMVEKTTLKDEGVVQENLDVQKFLTIATDLYNKKYENMSEGEKNIIKVLREGNDDTKGTLLRSMIKETISLINTQLKEVNNNIELKSKLLETKDVVYNMYEYNVDTISENIRKLYDIKSIFG
jgi:hypothetical protein